MVDGQGRALGSGSILDASASPIGVTSFNTSLKRPVEIRGRFGVYWKKCIREVEI